MKKYFFPPSINLEQTSSQQTAQYKSELVSGKKLVDCTGGFGIDSYFFSKKIETVFHCELNEDLQKIAAHNFKALGCENVQSFCENGVAFALKATHIDWLYIDPSRRSEAKGKVFFLKDCLPNVPKILDDCLQKIPNILIKTAPILDIKAGLQELKNVKNIHIIAVNNEVKELLWHVEKKFFGQPQLHAVNLQKTKTTKVSWSLNAEETAMAKIGPVGAYLYEPFTSVLKTGAFKWLSQKYDVYKLHDHSHLYTSDTEIEFPGKVFKVEQVIEYNKKNMKAFVNTHANVVSRNFKISVAELRKKYKIKESENNYLFFTTNYNHKLTVIVCEKL